MHVRTSRGKNFSLSSFILGRIGHLDKGALAQRGCQLGGRFWQTDESFTLLPPLPLLSLFLFCLFCTCVEAKAFALALLLEVDTGAQLSWGVSSVGGSGRLTRVSLFCLFCTCAAQSSKLCSQRKGPNNLPDQAESMWWIEM